MLRLSPAPVVRATEPSSPRETRRWYDLTASSHRGDVQEQIRREIRAGTIRVRPRPGDPLRVQIVPIGARMDKESSALGR